MNFVCVDGGGTKLNAIWFDENMRELGTARAKGINSTISPKAECQKQMRECFLNLFGDKMPKVLDKLYVTFGNGKEYAECLPEGLELREIVNLGESKAALLAGRGMEKGIAIVSGTGSDALYVNDNFHDAVGGVGAILGDQGSGVWMARQAVQNAVKYSQGWGEKTILTDMLKERLNIEKGFPQSLVRYLYDTPAPFQTLGKLLPIVAEAAKMGDEPCISAFIRGGRALAQQTISLIRKYPDFGEHIVTCGGAWKAYQPMFDEYERTLHEIYPEAQVHRPWFEHVLAGPMKYLLDNGYSPEEAKDKLLAAFPAYEWRM